MRNPCEANICARHYPCWQVSAPTMGLASFTLGVSWQARFAIDASPGFDPSRYWPSTLPAGVSAADERARASWRRSRSGPR